MVANSPESARAPWTAVAAILLAATLFGTTGTALAKGPAGTDPWAAASMRLVVGGLFLIAISRRQLRHVGRHATWIIVGSVGVAAYQTCFFGATDRTGVAVAAVTTIGISPLASRGIGRFRRRSAPSKIWWVAAAVLGLGLALQAFGRTTGTGSDGSVLDALGFVLAVAAGLAYALYAEAGSVLIECGVAPTASMALIFSGGAVITCPILFVADISWLTSSRGVWMILYQGVITLGVAYVAFGWGLERLTPSVVIMLTILEPVVASVLAVVVLDESPSAAAIVGGLLVLAGLPLAGLSASRSRSTVDA
jgi:DME family drug/metabolite transporter